MKIPALLLCTFVLLLAGCSTIPKNASKLSATLTEGIKKNGTECEKIIVALADVQRAILNEKWDDIYARVEKKYFDSRNITDAKTLTEADRRRIAANAAKTFYDLKEDIAAKEKALKLQLQENTTRLVEINDSIQGYLLSLEKLDQSRSAVTKKVSELAGVDLSSLSGYADKLIAQIN